VQIDHFIGEARKVHPTIKGNRRRLDIVIPKTDSEQLLDELNFGVPFHRNAQSNQGRPPKRFLVHSRPNK